MPMLFAGTFSQCSVQAQIPLLWQWPIGHWYADLSGIQELFAWNSLVNPQSRGFNVGIAMEESLCCPQEGCGW